MTYVLLNADNTVNFITTEITDDVDTNGVTIEEVDATIEDIMHDIPPEHCIWDAVTRTVQDDRIWPPSSLDELKADARAELMTVIDTVGEQLTAGIPRVIKDSWTAKADAARALLGGNDTPSMIHAEAADRGIPPEELAERVLKNSQRLLTVAAKMEVIRSTADAAIDDADTPEKLAAALDAAKATAAERAAQLGITVTFIRN